MTRDGGWGGFKAFEGSGCGERTLVYAENTSAPQIKLCSLKAKVPSEPSSFRLVEVRRLVRRGLIHQCAGNVLTASRDSEDLE